MIKISSVAECSNLIFYRISNVFEVFHEMSWLSVLLDPMHPFQGDYATIAVYLSLDNAVVIEILDEFLCVTLAQFEFGGDCS